MQQKKTIDEIVKLIKEKQNNREYGTITISFRAGYINDVDDKRTRKINADKDKEE